MLKLQNIKYFALTQLNIMALELNKKHYYRNSIFHKIISGSQILKLLIYWFPDKLNDFFFVSDIEQNIIVFLKFTKRIGTKHLKMKQRNVEKS